MDTRPGAPSVGLHECFWFLLGPARDPGLWFVLARDALEARESRPAPPCFESCSQVFQALKRSVGDARLQPLDNLAFIFVQE